MISGRKGRTRIGDGGVVDPTTITGDSTPNYDTSWIPGDNNGWDCADWMAFHQALVAEYGQPAANQKWQSLWDAQSWDAQPYNWCEYESDFYNYFKGVGIDVGDITAVAANTVSTVATDAGNIINNTANTASTISSWLLPVAGIVVLGGLYFAYETFLKPASK